MQLVPAELLHLQTLKRWISNASAAYYWSGSGLRYPFTDDSFLEDIRWGRIPSWSLLAADSELIGFGQYYDNHGRCHLARLIVAPEYRQCGIGQKLIEELIEAGKADLKRDECSLFVISSNAAARKCYKSLGFAESPWPVWQERFGEIIYMVRAAQR